MSLDEFLDLLRSITRPEVEILGGNLPVALVIFMAVALLAIFLGVTAGPFRSTLTRLEYKRLDRTGRARLRTELMRIVEELSGGEVDPVTKNAVKKKFSRPKQFGRVVTQLVEGGWIKEGFVERGFFRATYANLRGWPNADPAVFLTTAGQEGLRLNHNDSDILFAEGSQKLMRGNVVENITYFTGSVNAGQIHTGSGDNITGSMSPQQVAAAIARNSGLTSSQQDGLELAIRRQESENSSDGSSPVMSWLASVSGELGAASVDLVKEGLAQYLGLK